MGQVNTAWDEVQQRVRAGLQVQHWSKDKGDLQGRFTVDGVSQNRIEISSKSISGRRRISRADFEAVAKEWPTYLAGNVTRHDLRDSSQNTTYVISLLHWLDAN